ncbi:diacylglycerol O-acyltransferase 1 [Saccharata proteae CBS 121410]|uniref:diacylglycerol O-acyltransferase n=1 Tax=Saccharata proteae CBS 121410 TaxID=1314787 RepID=A0A9P4HUS8_9PEZI|nr:diacylglycerol O-acyltransferase 1 [Saccharata proteae CBS 121410]
MASAVETAVTTSTDIPVTQPEGQYSQANGHTNGTPETRTVRSPKKYRHVLAIHRDSKPSCLSQDAQQPTSFVGFRNLMVLVLGEYSASYYGVLICIRCHDYRRQDVVYGSILYFLVPCHLFVAYIIELAAAQQAKGAIARIKKAETAADVAIQQKHFQSTWGLIAFAHGVNATLNLIIATTVVYYFIHHPGIGTLCEIHAVIVWLKTCSYAFTNRDLRHAMLDNDSPSAAPLPEIYKSCPYPRNISIRNLTYFWWAPTLVYQPVYPRTASIRWPFVFKRVGEVFGLSIVIWIASAQYAAPLLQNSLDKIATLDLVSIVERVLKLSTISLFCWLAGFVALFHSFLNALAEVLRFGDREFYTEWWNATSIRQYWVTWNKPVTNFMRRHIYSPLVGRGVSPTVAQIIVFIFSGALHELLVGVPTHNIIGVAFIGMVFQIPLIFATDPLLNVKFLNGKLIGNLIFWVSFCLVGQPLAALLYFFAWQAKYGSTPLFRRVLDA